jgi:hypothetical protein
MTDPKRPRGRPPSPQGAKPRAEVQRAYRERRKAAGKVLRVIDTWTTMTPAEIAEMREGLGNALLELELRQQDVARLEVLSALAPPSIAGRMKAEIFQAACNTLRTVAVRRRKWNLR